MLHLIFRFGRPVKRKAFKSLVDFNRVLLAKLRLGNCCAGLHNLLTNYRQCEMQFPGTINGSARRRTHTRPRS